MYEPFPKNYVWNLSTNICLLGGGNIGEVHEANRPIVEASEQGGDAGTERLFDSWINVADKVCANAAADEARGFTLSAGT